MSKQKLSSFVKRLASIGMAITMLLAVFVASGASCNNCCVCNWWCVCCGDSNPPCDCYVAYEVPIDSEVVVKAIGIRHYEKIVKIVNVYQEWILLDICSIHANAFVMNTSIDESFFDNFSIIFVSLPFGDSPGLIVESQIIRTGNLLSKNITAMWGAFSPTNTVFAVAVNKADIVAVTGIYVTVSQRNLYSGECAWCISIGNCPHHN